MAAAVLLASLALLAPGVDLPRDDFPSGQFTGEYKREVTLNYLVSLPEGYETSGNRRWPLMLFLHGSGERGTDVQLVAVHGPIKEIIAGRRIPAIVIAPQSPPRGGWDPQELNALLNSMERKYRVDRDREYLTGLSMGGYGTYALAMMYPKRFAAIAPVCGGGDIAQAAKLKDIPLWATHGDKDEAVPIQPDIDLIAAIRAAGGSPRLDIIPGGTHDVWTDFYHRDDFYTWLFAQSRRR